MPANKSRFTRVLYCPVATAVSSRHRVIKGRLSRADIRHGPANTGYSTGEKKTRGGGGRFSFLFHRFSSSHSSPTPKIGILFPVVQCRVESRFYSPDDISSPQEVLNATSKNQLDLTTCKRRANHV